MDLWSVLIRAGNSEDSAREELSFPDCITLCIETPPARNSVTEIYFSTNCSTCFWAFIIVWFKKASCLSFIPDPATKAIMTVAIRLSAISSIPIRRVSTADNFFDLNSFTFSIFLRTHFAYDWFGLRQASAGRGQFLFHNL